jgi:cytochrome c oxidase subunit 4
VAGTEVAPVQPNEAGTPGSGSHAKRHPSPKEYVRIAMILGILTATEVSIYYMNLPHGLLISMLFTLAALKFSLVVLWFMHLKFDSRTYARFFIMGIAFALTLYTAVLLTFKVFSR